MNRQQENGKEAKRIYRLKETSEPCVALPWMQSWINQMKKKKQDNQENNTDKTFYAIKEMMLKF